MVRLSVVREIVRPWYVRAIASLATALGTYDVCCNQFGWLKIPALWGMSGSLLPWWGWLLILQLVAICTLFEFSYRRVGKLNLTRPFASGLYVGDIQLVDNRLGEGYLELAVRGFNGTGEVIDTIEIQGNILLDRLDTDPIQLPPAVLLLDRTTTKGIAPDTEIFLVLHQFVSPQVSKAISASINNGGARFTLTQFRIEMAGAADPNKRAALPIWSAVNLVRDDWARSTRIIMGRAEVTLVA